VNGGGLALETRSHLGYVCQEDCHQDEFFSA